MKQKQESALEKADIVVDRRYEGGRKGNASDDPLPQLIGVSNQGGFRYIGSKEAPRLVVLTSNARNLDWPDHLDKETGVFTYFGDNRKPGHELHDTPRFGNLLLRDMSDRTHASDETRALVPPVFIFANTGAGNWRDVEFLGLAVPTCTPCKWSFESIDHTAPTKSRPHNFINASFSLLLFKICP